MSVCCSRKINIFNKDQQKDEPPFDVLATCLYSGLFLSKRLCWVDDCSDLKESFKCCSCCWRLNEHFRVTHCKLQLCENYGTLTPLIILECILMTFVFSLEIIYLWLMFKRGQEVLWHKQYQITIKLYLSSFFVISKPLWERSQLHFWLYQRLCLCPSWMEWYQVPFKLPAEIGHVKQTNCVMNSSFKPPHH